MINKAIHEDAAKYRDLDAEPGMNSSGGTPFCGNKEALEDLFVAATADRTTMNSWPSRHRAKFGATSGWAANPWSCAGLTATRALRLTRMRLRLEPEHGLQVVFQNGLRVNKVGPYDGHLTNSDAYGDDNLEQAVYW
jgi:hypothetical protein